MYRHEITEIAPHTWCLSEFRLVNAFLIEGEEKAALVDTGCGIGDLAGEVRALTDKPLIILLTHTHFDHDGGVFEFPGVPVYESAGWGACRRRSQEYGKAHGHHRLQQDAQVLYSVSWAYSLPGSGSGRTAEIGTQPSH